MIIHSLILTFLPLVSNRKVHGLCERQHSNFIASGAVISLSFRFFQLLTRDKLRIEVIRCEVQKLFLS